MKKIISVSMCIVMLFCGCKKHIDAGIVITISGHMQDTLRNEPIGGAKLYIVEYDKTCFLCRPRPRAKIDSGYSDASGNYSISFTTTGRGTNYTIDTDDAFYQDYWGYLKSGYLNLNDTIINFKTFRLSTLKQHVTMTNIPGPPLFVWTRPAYTINASVWNFPADTTINLKLVPKAENYIYYQYLNEAGFVYRRIDSLMVNSLQDEFQMDVVLDTTTFKRL